MSYCGGLPAPGTYLKGTEIGGTEDTDFHQRIPVILSDISLVGHLGTFGLFEPFSGIKGLPGSTHGLMVFSPEDIVPTPDIDSGADTDRGVLLALRNAASFYQGGKIVNVAGSELMAEAKPYTIYPGFAFVAYPNRDSTPYKERFVKLFLGCSGV